MIIYYSHTTPDYMKLLKYLYLLKLRNYPLNDKLLNYPQPKITKLSTKVWIYLFPLKYEIFELPL